MNVGDLAQLVQGTVDGDAKIDITGLSGTQAATSKDLTFALNEARLVAAEQSHSDCILTTDTIRKSSKTLIRVANPKLAFLVLYQALYKPAPKAAFTHPTAVVSPTVKLGKNVWIGSHVTIEDHVSIGDNTIIESNVVIKQHSVIGLGCYLYPGVVLYANTIIKDHVILHGGVVVGSDGFGFVQEKGKTYKFPQLGKVIIEEHVEIGSNSTIDRGSLEDTIIGAHSKIDNLCHIAHNVKIGKHMIMAAQSGIAGSTVIGNHVTISGQVAITDNITVGDYAVIAGKSTVINDVKAKTVVWGLPARPIAQTKRQMAVVSWLTKNFTSISKVVKRKKE